MKTRNPLIDDNFPSQTLLNASGVLAFLQGSQPLVGCVYSSEDDYTYGHFLILGCIRAAIDYEKDRVTVGRNAKEEVPDAETVTP